MQVVPIEEPPCERSVSGESGRPAARGTIESITPQLSRLSRRAKRAGKRSGTGGGQPLSSRSPCPPKPPTK
jgi:hypothetical protein